MQAYNSLGEFFQRELKPSVRHIDSTAPLVVPCDGRVLHYGRCKDGIVEQVNNDITRAVAGYIFTDSSMRV